MFIMLNYLTLLITRSVTQLKSDQRFNYMARLPPPAERLLTDSSVIVMFVVFVIIWVFGPVRVFTSTTSSVKRRVPV